MSLIVVNFNSGRHLHRCLHSVLRTREDVETIVWDNASTDDSLVLPKDILNRIRIVRNDSNLGFAKAVNASISMCSGEYVLLLNPDTYADADIVSPLRQFIEQQEGKGVLGGRVLNLDGSPERACARSVPTPKAAFLRLTGLSLLFPKSKRISQYNLPDVQGSEPRRVRSVSGSFCFFTKEAGIRIGFDERFFLFGEDIDFCLRAEAAGEPVWFIPSATVTHHKGACTESRPIASLLHFYDSMLLFHKKHFAAQHSIPFNLVVFAGVCLLATPKLLAAAVVSPFRSVLESLKG
ncbi:MAG: glycosyltransferase family 2 protein [Candidatus Coatesbacteria bacterium]|nr:glycosyltransferase family 2 protein [Candidatus Coatesbacteria bacterium]